MNKTNHTELGCYGDGALGHQHTRDRCADVLGHYMRENFTSREPGNRWADITKKVTALDGLLRGEMSDDAGEEADACDWLNEHAPFSDAYWGWEHGDFGLWTNEDDDS